VTGTIYKFAAAVGTELPADIIQHNALVMSEEISTATGLTVATTPSGYKSGAPLNWCIGDSKTEGNSGPTSTYCSYLSQLNIPGVLVLNGGTRGQTLANYVSTGIINQAASIANMYSLTGGPASPRFAGIDMGINDIGSSTGADIYANFKSGINPLYGSGWKTIAISLTPNYASSPTGNTNRLTFNALLAQGGLWNGFVDWANDLRMTNAAYPDITNSGNVAFGAFDPYYQDPGLHPSAIGAAALSGRCMNKMNLIGEIGKGTIYSTNSTANVDIDMARGHNQTLVLTGDVTTLKIINGNQGDELNLTVCQDATGGHTVPTVQTGSGATATVSSAGVISLTAGGHDFDQNFQPVFYVSGLTCSTYPAYSSTISSGGVITGITAVRAGAGCSGAGTVTVVSTEPAWNNFNTEEINGLAAGKCLAQHFSFDGVGQSVN
jgi:hypothetical protein